MKRIRIIEKRETRVRIKPKLHLGQKVYDIRDKRWRGKIKTLGVEVSEVLWSHGLTEYVTNEYLRDVDELY